MYRRIIPFILVFISLLAIFSAFLPIIKIDSGIFGKMSFRPVDALRLVRAHSEEGPFRLSSLKNMRLRVNKMVEDLGLSHDQSISRNRVFPRIIKIIRDRPRYLFILVGVLAVAGAYLYVILAFFFSLFKKPRAFSIVSVLASMSAVLFFWGVYVLNDFTRELFKGGVSFPAGRHFVVNISHADSFHIYFYPGLAAYLLAIIPLAGAILGVILHIMNKRAEINLYRT